MKRLKPGGFAWLLAHEVRLAFRGGRRAGVLKKVWPIALLMAIPAAMETFAAYGAKMLPDAPTGTMLSLATLGLMFIVLLMTANACTLVLRTFHERADLDLLMSAPIPPARVLAAKAVGVYASVAAPILVLSGAFPIACAVFGHARWLAMLPMIVVAAVIATSLAFAVARALFRTIGAKAARLAIQIGSGLLGASVFLVMQGRQFAPETATRWMRHLIHAPPEWASGPARAAFGAPGPLALCIAFAALSAWAASRFAARALSQPIVYRVSVRRGPAAPLRFGSGMTRIVVLKELRLLARDPEMLSQVVLRLIYVIPVLGLVLRGDEGFDAPRLAAACTASAAMLAASLAWLTVCAEDAPELLAAAPVARALIARGKLIAACAPPLALVAVPALVVGVFHPLVGLVTLGVSAVAAWGGAAVQGWYGKPKPRSAFRSRQSGSLPLALGELAMAGGWAGAAGLLARGSLWAVAPALIACAILFAAADSRPVNP